MRWMSTSFSEPQNGFFLYTYCSSQRMLFFLFFLPALLTNLLQKHQACCVVVCGRQLMQVILQFTHFLRIMALHTKQFPIFKSRNLPTVISDFRKTLNSSIGVFLGFKLRNVRSGSSDFFSSKNEIR